MAYQPMYNAYAGVPYGYPGYYPQTTAPMGQPTTYQQPINGLIWVDGDQGVQMYQMPPNSTSPALFYKDKPMFAVKVTDGGGAATTRKFTFEENVENPHAAQGEFITKSDLEAFKSEIMEALNGKSSIPEA